MRGNNYASGRRRRYRDNRFKSPPRAERSQAAVWRDHSPPPARPTPAEAQVVPPLPPLSRPSRPVPSGPSRRGAGGRPAAPFKAGARTARGAGGGVPDELKARLRVQECAAGADGRGGDGEGEGRPIRRPRQPVASEGRQGKGREREEGERGRRRADNHPSRRQKITVARTRASHGSFAAEYSGATDTARQKMASFSSAKEAPICETLRCIVTRNVAR